MSMAAALSLTLALGLAVSASPRAVPGIPSAQAPQQWGLAVMETLQANLHLEPIRFNDLAPATATTSGAAEATAMAFGASQLGARYALPTQPINPLIQRELVRIWRLTVPAGSPSRAQVSASIESLRGEPGRLSLLGHEEVSIPVAVLERPVSVRLEQSGSRVLEGGIALQIPSATLQHAGQYSGRLVLRTEGF